MLELQKSLYTTKQLFAKLDRYVDYYEHGNWKNQRVLILGKINLNLNLEDYPFQIRQVKDIVQFEEALFS
ncbi:hypothetical protein [Cytobacillus firmus]|uniref:hypothetical protein n=1 Tax=Cytobacillus firmus TaxID=1399 RepID=UPI0018CC99BF|nr:hypothetical protein [Cytobacillus firmus]MBG9587698.1 hypothetical protein [Cytobacillus firmus]